MFDFNHALFVVRFHVTLVSVIHIHKMHQFIEHIKRPVNYAGLY